MSDTPDTPPQPDNAPEPQKSGFLSRVRSLWGKVPLKWQHYAGALVLALLVWLLTGKKELPPLPIEAKPPDGWEHRPDEIKAAMQEMEKSQGLPAVFSEYAAKIAQDAGGDNDQAVFFWDFEQKVLGKLIPCWNQGQVGSCVAHGGGRSAMDLILSQCARDGEEWQGWEVDRCANYGGMRVQIGGGRISGDGGVNAWMVKWFQSYGVIFAKKYPNIDLTTYSETLCRQLGRSGCPKYLEPEARLHPIKTVAQVNSSDEVWTAIGSIYPVPIASNVGFDTPLRGGFCTERGSWGHEMCIRGRFIDASSANRGKCFVIQNSWGDYLRSDGTNNVITYVGADGKPAQKTLPIGCFAVTASSVQRIVKQGDSFAISGFVGFPPQKIDWFLKANPANPPALARNCNREPAYPLGN